MLDTGWTSDRVDLLKKLWKEGLSASQIAGILGEGVTRSAVIGKVHRLKLAGRARPKAKPKPVRVPYAPKPQVVASEHATQGNPHRKTVRNGGWTPLTFAAPKIEPEPFIDPDEGVDVTGLIGLLQLNEKTCKFPYGDPLLDRFGFCGKPSRDGSPYCDHHHRRTHDGVWRP